MRKPKLRNLLILQDGILTFLSFLCLGYILHIAVNECIGNSFCLVVVWNLVTIAAERYLAVCKPFKHSGFTKQRAYYIFILVYLMGIPCTSLAAFQVINVKYIVQYYMIYQEIAKHFQHQNVTFS